MGKLNQNKTIQISDTIHGSIRLNFLEKQVLSTSIFNRLHNISQNSTVYLTFPTNRTKRFEHSIGTMLVCGNIFMASISNTNDEVLEAFFTEIEKIIDREIDCLHKYATKYRSKVGDKNLVALKINKYKSDLIIGNEYNTVVPVNVKKEYRNLYLILFQSIRLSALLHDVGHPPFSHIAEFALKNLWNMINTIKENDRTDRQKKYIESMKKYFESNHDLHEQIGNIITEKVMFDIIEDMPKSEENNKELLYSQIFKIIVAEVTLAILKEKHPILTDLHRIVDGALDGDRLDYVCRDPLNSGLNLGKIEYDRIISSMMMVKVDSNYLFAPSTKLIDSVEDFFSRRWKMYKQIIYHHRVIKTDYLLQSCIEELAWNYLKESEEEEECKNILPYDISGLWKAIEDMPSHQAFFNSLIQWDDGWLMTILKKHYFVKYADDIENITYKLEELLSNKKNYFSIIKRMEDFVSVDRALTVALLKEYPKIIELVNKNEKNEECREGPIVVPMDLLLKHVMALESIMQKYIDTGAIRPNDGFVLTKIKKIYDNLLEEGWLRGIILASVDEIKNDPQYKIKDVITVFKNVKTGVQEGLAFYKIRNGQIDTSRFSDLSQEGEKLLKDLDFFPVFYLYILKQDDSYVDYELIKNGLGNMVGQKIANRVIEKLKEIYLK